MSGTDSSGSPPGRAVSIALTGSSSTGKTTLALALMQEPRIIQIVDTLIPEGVRELLRAEGHTSIDKMTLEERLSFQRTYFDWKRNAESGKTRYLVDRSFLDVAAVCIERDRADQIDELRTAMIESCRRFSENYTLHIHLPYGAIPFVFDGVRSADADLHGRIAARIERFLDEWNLRHVTLKTVTIEDRVAEVCDLLKREGVALQV